MSWTDERINLLKRMWKEGKSAADIAKTLGKGVTRNAVIGKAHRMGLSGRPSPIKKPASVKKESAAPKKEIASTSRPAAASGKKAALTPAPSAKLKSNPALDREAEELKKIEKSAPQIGGGVALVDLTERMCKWPIGDPKEADFSFCGLGIRQGTPYCPSHAAMAYQTSSRGRGGAHPKAVAAAAATAVAAVNDDKDVEVDDVEVEVDDVEDTADTED
jgi:GcrA cell cycle regulator